MLAIGRGGGLDQSMSAPEPAGPTGPLPLPVTDSVTVARPPEQVWAMVADVTRHGDWSPVCTGCTWDEGDGPAIGARFTGRNTLDGRTWETRSVVVAAEPGVEFAWQVNEDWVRWGFTTRPAPGQPGATVLEESWEFLPAGLAGFRAGASDEASAQRRIDARAAQARDGVPATLAAIAALIERETETESESEAATP